MDYVLVIGGILIYFAGCLTMFLVLYKNTLDEVTTLKSLQKDSPDKKNKDFHTLLSSLIDLTSYENTIDAIEAERERIGEDAHDEFAARLNSLFFNLQIVSRESHLLSDESNGMISDMRSAIKYTIVAFRRIIYDLHPPIGTLGEAVNELCARYDRTKGTRILFRSIGEPLVLTDKHKTNLYRIAQELLNNCLKHSGGWNIYVTLSWTKEGLKLIVKDTGKGLREDYISKIGKHGITGLFLRIERIGAKAKFNTPPVGVEFELYLPFADIQSLSIIESSD